MCYILYNYNYPTYKPYLQLPLNPKPYRTLKGALLISPTYSYLQVWKMAPGLAGFRVSTLYGCESEEGLGMVEGLGFV